jgi:hypothetical protein
MCCAWRIYVYIYIYIYMCVYIHTCMLFKVPICYGKWWFPTCPLQKPVDIVVGQPINVPLCPTFTEEQVDELLAQYIQALQELYDLKKHDFPNHAHKTLVVL